MDENFVDMAHRLCDGRESRNTVVICANPACKWHDDNSDRCTCPKISLANGIVQTLSQGAMEYWRCDQYEMSDRAKQFKLFFEQASKGKWRMEQK